MSSSDEQRAAFNKRLRDLSIESLRDHVIQMEAELQDFKREIFDRLDQLSKQIEEKNG